MGPKNNSLARSRDVSLPVRRGSLPSRARSVYQLTAGELQFGNKCGDRQRHGLPGFPETDQADDYAVCAIVGRDAEDRFGFDADVVAVGVGKIGFEDE